MVFLERVTRTISSNPKLLIIAPLLGAADAVLKQSDKLAVIAPIMSAADGVLKESDKLAIISPIMGAADAVLKPGINFCHTGTQVSADPGPRGGDRGIGDRGDQGL